MAFRLRDTLARIFQAESEAESVLETPVERRSTARRPAYQTALIEWLDAEKGVQALAGRMENRSRKGFGLRVPRLIARGKTILVTPEEEAPIKAVVRNCSTGEGGWYLGVELIPNDKRRSDREPMHYAARVTCTRAGRRDDLAVIIRDASEGGVQLESPEPLKVDQMIEVTHLGMCREGVVSHCKQRDDGYRIGVQFIGPPRKEQSNQVN